MHLEGGIVWSLFFLLVPSGPSLFAWAIVAVYIALISGIARLIFLRWKPGGSGIPLTYWRLLLRNELCALLSQGVSVVIFVLGGLALTVLGNSTFSTEFQPEGTEMLLNQIAVVAVCLLGVGLTFLSGYFIAYRRAVCSVRGRLLISAAFAVLNGGLAFPVFLLVQNLFVV